MTVFEKHDVSRESGFGIVFPTDAMSALTAADQPAGHALTRRALTWESFEVHRRSAIDGVRSTTGVRWRPSFALSRAAVLQVLGTRCRELGVDLRFGTPAPPLNRLSADHDLVVAADGAGSAIRTQLRDEVGATESRGRCRYLWLDTDAPLTGFHFDFVETPAGLVQTHAYPYGPASTLVVEMREEVYQNLQPSAQDCAEYWKELLQGAAVRTAPGHRDWRTFRTVHCDRWSHDNVVLIGDAAHTTHFSIGAGTKLAMGDATVLAESVTSVNDLGEALRTYQDRRRAPVSRAALAAGASQRWLEEAAGETARDPSLFAFRVLSRSKRMTQERVRRHDPAYVSVVERAFVEDGPQPVLPRQSPLAAAWKLGEVIVPNRVAAEVRAQPHSAVSWDGLRLAEQLAVPPGLLMAVPSRLYSDSEWASLRDRLGERTAGVVGVRLCAYEPRGVDQAVNQAAEVARAASRAERAGYDVLELGCFEESAESGPAELFTVTETVRRTTDLPIIVRMSVAGSTPDAMDQGGLDHLVSMVLRAGADAVSVLPEAGTSGALPTWRYGRWDFAGNAMAVMRAVRRVSHPAVPVVAVGDGRSADEVGTALLAGYTDCWMVRDTSAEADAGAPSPRGHR